MKPPLSLVERRAKRGDLNPLACAKGLVEALEADPTLADELVIITVKRDAEGLTPEVRVASPKSDLDILPHLLGLFSMVTHALLNTYGYHE